jgi:hypothetical protein
MDLLQCNIKRAARMTFGHCVIKKFGLLTMCPEKYMGALMGWDSQGPRPAGLMAIQFTWEIRWGCRDGSGPPAPRHEPADGA